MAEENNTDLPDATVSGDKLMMRQQAEELLMQRHVESDKISPADVQLIIHKLQVHEIELEMQNEELRCTQQELEASRKSILTFMTWPRRGMSP
jgi:hypothetical protein